jgi:SAM-dependent methyltransferase
MVKYVHKTTIHNTKAASEVVPLIIDRVKPASVVDVGCGIGTWLEVFKQQGVPHVRGIDGDYVDQTMLHIKEEEFLIADLETPPHLELKFELALCLEVAEHLKPESAAPFISFLTSLSDHVIFSAAIPGQGGQNHLNEQWLTYWEKLFNNHGFVIQDWLRSEIWNNPKVDVWYKQNMVSFVKNGQKITDGKIDLVHPELFELVLKSRNESVGQLKKNRGLLDEIQKRYFINGQGRISLRKFFSTFISFNSFKKSTPNT